MTAGTVTPRQVFSVGHVSSTNSRYLNESGVMVSLQLNEIQTTVMVDSGAQPSIIDTESLEKLGVDCRGRPGRVHGVCATPIKTRGVVDLEVDFGTRHPVKHKFNVLDSREQTVILGRDFLKRFKSTEFDWENHCIRLGECWLPTEASLWGGRVLSRAGAIRCVLEEPNFLPPTVDWNINPDLNQQEKGTLRTLLEEYLEVFAINPKKPSKPLLQSTQLRLEGHIP